MTVVVTIELVAGTFRGRAQNQARTTWPPSPFRLVGALLAGAHSLPGANRDNPSGECAAARQALQLICQSPAPEISAPTVPLEVGNRLVWFAPSHPDKATYTDELNSGKALGFSRQIAKTVSNPSAVLDHANRENKLRTLSLLPSGRVVQYRLDVDIREAGQWDALRKAAAAVPFFGSSTDLAVIRLERDAERFHIPYPDNTLWSTRRGVGSSRVTLRGWSAKTLQWFDDNFRARSVAPIPADYRIPEWTFAPSGPTRYRGPSGPNGVAVLALSRATTLDGFAALRATVTRWNTIKTFPALDLSRPNRVLGVGLYGGDIGAAVATAPGGIFQDPPGGLKAYDPRTWAGPAQSWVSATPAATHHDQRVAQAQIAHELRAVGLTLMSMQQQPFARWQTRKIQRPRGHGLWFITARSVDGSKVTGPIQIGAGADLGDGLLIPYPVQKDRQLD